MSEHGAGAAGSGGSGAGSTAAGTAGGAGGRGAKEILASVREGFLIGGEWTTAGGSGRLPFVNPSTERVEAWFPEAGAEAVSAAVTAAVAGWEAWRRVSAAERAAKLRRISEAIAAAAGRFAEIESLNTGKPLAEAAGDAEEAVRAFAYCAAVAEKQAARLDGKEEVVELPDGSFGGSMRWESIGVVAGICPWNYPLMMAAWKIAPALGAGCSVVIKPSELTPYTTLALGQLITELGVLPAGVLNVVTGGRGTGKLLVRDRRVAKVSFTGSVEGGEDVMRGAAEGVRPVTLELGGKSAAIVCESVKELATAETPLSAILDNICEWLAFSTWWNAGQVCSATARVLVHESLAKEVAARMAERSKKMRVGGPFEHLASGAAPNQMGPIISHAQFMRVRSILQGAVDAGATLVAGGPEPLRGPGYFLAPTVLADVLPSNPVWEQEVFGPVLHITPFRDLDHAIELANRSSYGLAGAAFGSEADTTRVVHGVRSGILWANCAQPTFCHLPWGGYLKSGVGREMGPEPFKPFLQPKAIVRWLDPTKPLGWY